MKHSVWSTIEVFLRLPDVPTYVPGRVCRATGRVNYRTRLAAPGIWAQEVRIAEMNARRAAPNKFQSTATPWRCR